MLLQRRPPGLVILTSRVSDTDSDDDVLIFIVATPFADTRAD